MKKLPEILRFILNIIYLFIVFPIILLLTMEYFNPSYKEAAQLMNLITVIIPSLLFAIYKLVSHRKKKRY